MEPDQTQHLTPADRRLLTAAIAMLSGLLLLAGIGILSRRQMQRTGAAAPAAFAEMADP